MCNAQSALSWPRSQDPSDGETPPRHPRPSAGECKEQHAMKTECHKITLNTSGIRDCVIRMSTICFTNLQRKPSYYSLSTVFWIANHINISSIKQITNKNSFLKKMLSHDYSEVRRAKILTASTIHTTFPPEKTVIYILNFSFTIINN